MALKLGIQTYLILTNNDDVCISSLSSILLAVSRETYRLDVLVADKPAIQLRAGDPKLPVQVVGRLLVGVGDLSENPFVVIDHFRSRELNTIGGDL